LLSVNDQGKIDSGLKALTDGGQYILDGNITDTMEVLSPYPINRHFDHRIRLEVETQMGIPPTVVWSTDEKQKLSHVIATFPISRSIENTVWCNNENAVSSVLSDTTYAESSLLGDITWRRAEDKVSERYLLQSSQFLHNMRLELFIVRKEWSVLKKQFLFVREKMVFADGEFWSGKVRFRSIN
jgi:hypothetical protein